MTNRQVSMLSHFLYYLIAFGGGLFCVAYMSILLTPSSFRVDNYSFEVDDIVVGEKIKFKATRNARYNTSGYAIDEIEIIGGQTVYWNKRPILTEQGLKYVEKEIDYIHLLPGEYELRIVIDRKLPLGITKRQYMQDTYTVR